ncbi:MAG: hypothetical protein ACXVXV_08545 [Blastococcus sp.]
MTEPSSARPVPGPPRPGPGSTEPAAPDSGAAPAAERAVGEPFTGLEAKPVAEHVAVFEAEHSRLQRELGTIDQL